MLVTKILILVLVIVGESTKLDRVKNKYKWNEEVQLCSPHINYLVDIICDSDFSENERYKRSPVMSQGLHDDCCLASCTPRHILNSYCQYPERRDTTSDLIVFPVLSDFVTVSSTSRTTTKRPRSVNDPIITNDIGTQTLTKLMYCYMGVKKYCNQGLKQLVRDLNKTIQYIEKYPEL